MICRLVSMFDFVEVLVDESDRRRALTTDIAEDYNENTLEFVISFTSIRPSNDIHSQDRTFKGFELLIRHVSNIEEKLLTMDLDELAVYFREVSYSTCWFRLLFFRKICSFVRVRELLEETTRLT